MTTNDHFARVAELFERCRLLDHDQRRRLLDSECLEDDALRAEIESLLTHHDATNPLDGTGAGDAAALISEAVFHDAAEPTRIGKYTVRSRLGEGGMGAVYEATQENPSRSVAIKVIKAGMDSGAVIARFESERQTLAMMNHPGIAHVYDAGRTEQGRPWFAMELVRGTPLTNNCDENRLPTKRRLELFRRVCHAIGHAHQKGVIHRDIKPSNVLVAEFDGEPTPKVIDFGIAKALSPGTQASTLTSPGGSLIGTPAYMAPEQARLDSSTADTRADIYSLGVLLYELLTGTTPFAESDLQSRNLADMVRVICHDEPPAPSTRMSTIGVEATDAATQRSSDPRSLALTLKGDLDWIVMTCLEKDPDRRYESVGALSDDIRRHLADEPVFASPRGAVYRTRKFVRRHRVGVGVAAAFLALLVGTLSAISIALSRTLAAEREAQRAQDDSDAFNTFLLEDLIGSASPERIGHTVTVVSAIERALGDIDERFADRPISGARIRSAIGGVYHGLGLLDEARSVLERSLEDQRRLIGPDAPQTLETSRALAAVLHHLGRADEAESTIEGAHTISETALDPDDPTRLAIAAQYGEILQTRGAHDRAEPMLRTSVEGMRRVLPPNDPGLLAALSSLGASLSAQRRLGDAEPIYREALGITLELYPVGHPARLSSLNNAAVLLMNLDKPTDARPLLKQLVNDASASLPEGHWQIAWSRYSYAACLVDLGEDETALPLLRLSHRDAVNALGANHTLTERALSALAAALHRIGDPQAIDANRDSVKTRLRVANPDQRRGVNRALVEYLSRHGRPDESSEHHTDLDFLSDAAERMIEDDHPDTARFIENLACALIDVGEFTQADRWLRSGYARFAGQAPPDHEAASRMAEELAKLLLSESLGERAEEWANIAEDHRAAAASAPD